MFAKGFTSVFFVTWLFAVCLAGPCRKCSDYCTISSSPCSTYIHAVQHKHIPTYTCGCGCGCGCGCDDGCNCCGYRGLCGYGGLGYGGLRGYRGLLGGCGCLGGYEDLGCCGGC